MQFKEFSLLSPIIESGEVLKAIEVAIPPEVIEQVLGETSSGETRSSQAAITPSSLSGNCDESMVVGFDANCLEESGQRLKNAVAKIGSILASTKPFINYRKLGRDWDAGQ